MPSAGPHLDRLVAVFERLRAPGGCPWDRERSLCDLGKHLLEECEEAVTEIRRLTRRRGDPEALREELGDLLCNLVFTVQIARERGWFGMEDVARGAVDKIVRRHPHVFGGAKAGTAKEVEDLWANIKARERAGVPGELSGFRRKPDPGGTPRPKSQPGTKDPLGPARGSGRSARSRRSRRS